MLKLLSSTRITVVCLFLLFILTFWGTIAQVHQGLYAAQERFFNSFFFLAAGFIPFPGAQLILWVLFINLVSMTILTFKKHTQLSYMGLLITHLGILLYFVAAFLVFHVYKESAVRLSPGTATNVSSSYTEWEVAYWVGNDKREHQVNAIDTNTLKSGVKVPFANKDFTLIVKEFYPNSEVSKSSISPKAILKQREENIAGGVFNLRLEDKSYDLILYGMESRPTEVMIKGKLYHFMLRHKRFPLPFVIKLDHFKAEFHSGTDMAKSFESLVTISTGALERQVRIYMNNPLRYKDYTLYQASYDVDEQGRQSSTLAVVRNSARILPYIACFIVFFGLALHFLTQALISKRS